MVHKIISAELPCHDHSFIACSRHTHIFLFFVDIPFVVYHTINATTPERLQQGERSCPGSLRRFTQWSNTQAFNWEADTLSLNYRRPCVVHIRGGTGSGVPESTPAGFCVFLSYPDPDPESKFGKNPTRIRSHFSISAVAGVCVVIWVNYVWIDDCSRSLNRSRILKFETLPDPDPDAAPKILEQERSLKTWLRPPLVGSFVSIISLTAYLRHIK